MLLDEKLEPSANAQTAWTPNGSRFAVRPQLSLITSEPNDDVIDFEHLRRYTFGDIALEKEVLGLFLSQLPVTISALQESASEADRRRAAHTLKGSARAVGAWRIAKLAEQAEQLLVRGTAAALAQAVADIDGAARDAAASISATYA
jgi:HPt (histidine-containing phosphotransfer) domain-containing protein